MCVTFHKNDNGYDAWRQSHKDGFIFNHFGGQYPNMNKMHRANCKQVSKPKHKGRWTVVEKVCCDNGSCIKATADRLRNGRKNWETGIKCFGSRWAYNLL